MNMFLIFNNVRCYNTTLILHQYFPPSLQKYNIHEHMHLLTKKVDWNTLYYKIHRRFNHSYFPPFVMSFSWKSILLAISFVLQLLYQLSVCDMQHTLPKLGIILGLPIPISNSGIPKLSFINDFEIQN